MAQYKVRKAVDAFVEYDAVVEIPDDELDIGETDGSPEQIGLLVTDWVSDHTGEIAWGEGTPNEFDATGYVQLDDDGFEIDGTQVGKAYRG